MCAEGTACRTLCAIIDDNIVILIAVHEERGRNALEKRAFCFRSERASLNVARKIARDFRFVGESGYYDVCTRDTGRAGL